MAISKKWLWGHVSAAAIFALLVATLVAVECQRSGLKNEKTRLSNELESANAKIDSLGLMVRDYADTICDKKLKLCSLQSVVRERNDSISKLNSALEECQKNKKKKTTSARGVQTAAVRKQPSPSNVVRVADTCGNMRANVRLNSSSNTGNIVINTDNSGASVVLSESSSNSGNIVIGNGNVINVNNYQNGRNVSVNDTVTPRPQNDSIICTVRWVETTARIR